MNTTIFRIITVPFLAAAVSCASVKINKKQEGARVYEKNERVSLSEEKSIRGKIINSKTGKPVPEARVEVKNANMGIGYYLTKSDSNGNFRIDNFISQLRYIVEVDAEGYVSYRSGGVISPGDQKIYLDPESVIKGKVTDSSGNPVEGVEVKIKKGYSYSYSSFKPVFTKTDGRGMYSFKKIPGGRYYIFFEKTGYIPESVNLKYIRKGESFTLPMSLYRPAGITGKIVIQGFNVPAVGVNVTARGAQSHSAATFQDGSFQLVDLKPGKYKLSITHEGFYTINTPIVYIREGSVNKDYNFVVNPKPPEIKVYSYRYTFAPGNKVEFNLRTFRLENVKATIYSVPVETFLRGKSDPMEIDPVKEKFKVKVRWDEPVRDFKPYQWRYQTIDVKEPLPTGGYCMEARGAGRVIDRKFFTVTSVGVVFKRSRNSVYSYVTNLVTNKPVPDASIVVFDSTPADKKYRHTGYTYKAPKRIEELPVKIVGRGKTDKSGLYRQKLVTDKQLSVLAISKDGSYALTSTGSPAAFQRERIKYMVYTERPVYRSGDTVYYKIIGKKRNRKFTPLSDGMLYYKIMNRDNGKELDRGKLRLDDWGTAHDKVEIKERYGLGIYEIRVGPSLNNLYDTGYFYVEEYRKPEFKIDIKPSSPSYINGDTVEFKVEARFFFGAPLKNGLVRYRFYETRLRDTDTVYWWEEDSLSHSYSRLKLEGERYLDSNGILALRIHSGSVPFDREITLEATVTDQSNISITSRGKVRVGRGEFYIKINPNRNFFASNEKKKEIEIKTISQAGKPVPARLELKLFRYIWKPYQRIYVHERRPYLTRIISTESNGKAVVRLPEKFMSYGEFDIVVSGTDRRNNLVTASRVVWIYNYRGGKVASRFKNLELSVNRKRLEKPGDLTCLLKTKYPDSYVFLTLEGKDIYWSKVVNLQGNITPVKVPVKEDYAPNFYLTAVMQRKRALYTRTVGISIPRQDTGLKITIKPGKEKYLPGEKAEVDIKVTDGKNRPLKADLSLSAVDESIYYVRPDHTPKMQDFFYAKISNWVLTGYSYPITILAGAAKEDKIKVREKFEDTAFWKADIRTDRWGNARVDFTLPDNLTTWRLTARGHDRKGRVGEKKKKFMVTQDLIARIGKPRFMIEKDNLSLISIVTSNTERGLPGVDIDLKVDGKTIPPADKGKISLPGFGSAKKYHSLTVPEKQEETVVQLTAKGDTRAKDALKIKIPVEKRGAAYKLFGLGDFSANRKIELEPIKKSDDFTFVPRRVTLSLNPSPLQKMLKATKFLVEYPYGCVEQTINRFMPLLAVNRLIRDSRYSGLVSAISGKKLDSMVRAGISRLQLIQNSDGSWGWWGGDRGNEYLTGYVLYSLKLAKDFGYNVNNSTVKKGIKAIERMFHTGNRMSNDARAFLLYAYTLWGHWNADAYLRLTGTERSVYSTAFLLRSVATVKESLFSKKSSGAGSRETVLSQLMGEIKEKRKIDSRGIYWQGSRAQRWGWPGSRTEISAHVLAALVEAGDRSAVSSRIVSSLSGRSQGSYWRTTKETATVILALYDYMKKRKGSVGGPADVKFTVNGKPVGELKYDPGEKTQPNDLIKTVKLSGLEKKGKVVVEATGKAGSDASYDVTVSGTLYFNPSGFLSFLKSEDKGLDLLSNGIKLFRSFQGITRVRDMRRNEYLVPGRLSSSGDIRVGDQLLVKVRFRAADDFEYLVLEDYLPSGFEVIKEDAYDYYKPYVRSERWDNRMVFFFNNVAKGKVYEIAYIIRAELPGRFIVRPARMECMYDPEIQGWSSPTLIEVKKKK